MPSMLVALSVLVVAQIVAAPDDIVAPDPFSPARRTAVVTVAEGIKPTVVSVFSEQVVQTRVRSDSFWEDFNNPKYRKEFATTSLGSGVLIDPHHVLTNHHVVAQAERVKIKLSDRRELRCTIVGSDPNLDLAVLRVETSEDLPHVKLADSRDVMVGETVIAIGNPFGLGHTVTAGVVSALHRNIYAPDRVFHDFLQTDASINPGNSGGPLLDIEGRLVGINTAIYGGAQGIGFAIPVNRAARIATEIIATQKVRQGWLGVDVAPLTRDEARTVGFERPEGVKVRATVKDGPAASQGLVVDDVIMEIEGFPVTDERDFAAKMRDYTPGSVVDLVVLRGKTNVPLTITTKEAPDGFGRRVLENQLGLSLVPATDELAEKYGLPKEKGYVVTTVRARSVADKAKLSEGDMIRFSQREELVDDKVLDKVVLDGRRAGRIFVTVQRKNRAFDAGFEL